MFESIEWAKRLLGKLNPADKHDTMLRVAAIMTKLLEPFEIKPIIVGGFSVEIYTQRDYSTHDIDFVVHDINMVSNLLLQIGFQKEGRHLVHENLKVAIEFPDTDLAGSYTKISEIEIDEDEGLYVYVISLEDIIMDRLRAYLHWKEVDSKEWGIKLLSGYFDQLDLEYMKSVRKGAETEEESKELQKWIKELQRLL